MPKSKSFSKKSSRNYAKQKHGNIKQKKFEKKINQEKKIKENKLMGRDFSDSDDEMDRREKRHIQLLKKSTTANTSVEAAAKSESTKKDTPVTQKHEVTEEEIALFWQQLEMKKGAAKSEEDAMVDQLLADVQDDYDVIETDFEGNTTEQQLDDEDNADEVVEDSEEEQADDEEPIENDEDDGAAATNITTADDLEKQDDENAEVDDDEEDDVPVAPEKPQLTRKEQKKLNEKDLASAFGMRIDEFATSSEFIKKILITKEMTRTWIEAAQEGKKKAVKQLLVAFYTASLQFGERTNEEDNAFQISPFRIDSPSTYMRVVLGALKFAPEAFWKLMSIPSTTTTMPSKDLLRKKKIQPLVALFCKAAVRFFTFTSKADALKYALQYLVGGLPFFSTSVTNTKSLIRILLGFLHHSDEVVRVRTFIVLHEIASKYPKPMPELVLKGVYYTFFQYATEYKPENAKILDFHKNCIVELYGVNFDLSYRHAYSYIRGLAETFQNALKNSSVPVRNALINWRFANCMDCWTQVLKAYPADDELGELIYPFTQLIMGVAVLFKENPLWVPLRLRCARWMNELAVASGRFIPSCSILLSMLKERNLVEMKSLSSATPLDLDFKVRLSDKAVRTVEFQRMAINEWIFQVAFALLPHARTVAFPEIANPALRAIITFRHDYFGRRIYGTAEKRRRVTNDAKFLENIKRLQKAIEDHTNDIVLKRANVTFSPHQLIEAQSDAQKKDSEEFALFDKNQVTGYERFFEVLKKEHDAEVLTRIMSYQQQLLSDGRPKDEIDMELDREEDEEKDTQRKRKRDESEEETEGVERKTQKKRVKNQKKDSVTTELDLDEFFDG